MKVGVLCEYSGVVRDAFIRAGHDAISCDLLPTEAPGPHIQGDCLAQDWSGYDLLICHPPCTYLCSMGIWWNHKRPERWPLTEQAAEFFMAMTRLPAPRIAIENPIGTMSVRHRKPDQIIQPWQFGHEATKPTCLWLKGLPPLLPTKIVSKGRFYVKANGQRMAAWSHVTSGTDKEKRWRVAARTFDGIANAMAQQWGSMT